jgi:carbohydrate-selective porin OprB
MTVRHSMPSPVGLALAAPIWAHFVFNSDLQYVVHPSANRSGKNALVMMIHFEISP